MLEWLDQLILRYLMRSRTKSNLNLLKQVYDNNQPIPTNVEQEIQAGVAEWESENP